MEKQQTDINSLIGLLLISAILVWFYMIPASNNQANMASDQDSLITESTSPVVKKPEKANIIELQKVDEDLIKKQEKYSLKNKNLNLQFSNLGARVTSAELLNYQTYDSSNVNLINEEESKFNLQFYDSQSKKYETGKMLFNLVSKSDSTLIFRSYFDLTRFIQFSYTLRKNNMLDLDVHTSGMSDVIGYENLQLQWETNIPRQEKSLENERYATTAYYCFRDNEVSNISERKDGEKYLKEIKWIAFKQQFFSSILINDDIFESVDIKTQTNEESDKYVKKISASTNLKYKGDNITIPLHFYYGPNHFKTLKSFNNEFEELIPLGWGVFGWINQYCIIWLFSVLENTNMNYGIIILLIALIIKLILFPFTYKSYISMAKMRVLKPEIDVINEKYEDPLKRQQATMSLYSKAGANPLGGCLPMLLQLPVLIALFRFFPASVELRQKSFLWADDLSSYDSILDLPFHIPFYGDHVSLFTLLMTVSTIIYTKINSDMTGNSNQMPQMKYMMYFMPIIFLGVFNNYAAALSYYYFIANVVTFGQQFAIRKFVDDNEIKRRIEESKRKPKKKSSFQKRLEEIAKQKGYKPPKK